MSDLLTIGSSGASAYRTALEVVGENIVNAETPGYARKQVVLRESATSAGSQALYLSRTQFGGVDPAGVRRAWDEFRADDSRYASSAAQRADVRVRWFGTIETALADGQTGVGQSVTQVFTTAATLASDPGNAFSRRAFLNAVDGAASAFRGTTDALARLSTGIAAEADATVVAANADMAALSRLNIQLRRAVEGSSTQVQLLDERDRLLDNLAQKLEIDVTPGAKGSVTVTLARSGGQVLVGEDGPAELSVAKAADGRLALGVTTGGSLQAAAPVSGRLAALVEVAGTVSDRRAQLDAVATRFATMLNDWSAAGTDATGAAGTALLAFDPANAAATLAPAIANRDPATVAAARVTDNGDGTFTTVSNGNLLALADGRAADGTETTWSTIVAGQSQTFAAAKAEQTSAAARRDGAFASRDEVSGIDLDFEASELLRYQQAYNGSAKIIQVARETLQMIMDVL